MSKEARTAELREKSEKLCDGPLKHIRAAALAAALVPLASVVATPVSAQTAVCPSGGVCGFVFNDLNHNGIQDVGEPGIEGVHIFVSDSNGVIAEAFTGPDGTYTTSVSTGTVTVSALIPTGDQASPANVGNDALDS